MKSEEEIKKEIKRLQYLINTGEFFDHEMNEQTHLALQIDLLKWVMK